MKVLVACEHTGAVRDAFARKGCDAWSCDLLPDKSAAGGNHRQCDIRDMSDELSSFDLLIAHPPCTFLCASGMHWTTRGMRDPALTTDALAFAQWLMDAPVDRICIENPVGLIGSAIRKADQYVQPYEYGHNASKRTGLWLKGLPILTSDTSQHIAPRIVFGEKRWANQDWFTGQNRLGQSASRWSKRSATYKGVATAMAQQWGSEL